MKTKKMFLPGILGIAIAGLLITGCHKKSDTPPTTATDNDITAAQDEASGTQASNDAKSVSDDAMQESTTHRASPRGIFTWRLKHIGDSCSVVLDSTSGDSVIVTINFGSSPNVCKDYKYREGKILVSWPVASGLNFWEAYFNKGTRITETFSGYEVGSSATQMNQIAGTRSWTNMGQDSIGYVNWNFSANLTITRNTGKVFTWTSTRTNTLTYTSGAWYWEVTGSATGTTESGKVYSLNIGSPIYATALPWWLGGCFWPIESGTVTITRSNSTDSLTINFGTLGTCSEWATATITIDGNPTSYQIAKGW